jgi:hypothetical protein
VGKGESDKGDFMSRSRSLYCHSDTGPTVLFATEIASEITCLRPEIARVGPEMRNVPTVSFVPNGTFRLSRDQEFTVSFGRKTNFVPNGTFRYSRN